MSIQIGDRVSDLTFLQALYHELNGDGRLSTAAVCPKCDERFEVLLDVGAEA